MKQIKATHKNGTVEILTPAEFVDRINEFESYDIEKVTPSSKEQSSDIEKVEQ